MSNAELVMEVSHPLWNILASTANEHSNVYFFFFLSWRPTITILFLSNYTVVLDVQRKLWTVRASVSNETHFLSYPVPLYQILRKEVENWLYHWKEPRGTCLSVLICLWVRAVATKQRWGFRLSCHSSMRCALDPCLRSKLAQAQAKLLKATLTPPGSQKEKKVNWAVILGVEPKDSITARDWTRILTEVSRVYMMHWTACADQRKSCFIQT